MGKKLLNHIGSHEPDNLINSALPAALTYSVGIRAGQGELARGTVLARSSTGDYVVLGTEAGTEETLTASCILADAVDASGASEALAIAYRTGHMNRNALIVATGYDLTEDDEEELRRGGILLSDAQKA